MLLAGARRVRLYCMPHIWVLCYTDVIPPVFIQPVRLNVRLNSRLHTAAHCCRERHRGASANALN